MSALDEMEERNQHEAYQRGFKEGAKRVLSTLSDLVDGRIEGLDILKAIPAEQRAESAQDDKIKGARFELGLVHDEIESLRNKQGQK
jgi:hypothetical protein